MNEHISLPLESAQCLASRTSWELAGQAVTTRSTRRLAMPAESLLGLPRMGVGAAGPKAGDDRKRCNFRVHQQKVQGLSYKERVINP
jgi:hypothetical protein